MVRYLALMSHSSRHFQDSMLRHLLIEATKGTDRPVSFMTRVCLGLSLEKNLLTTKLLVFFTDSSDVRPFDSNGDSLPNTWSFDPDEPTYCICNQVSYGEMVACDNDDVSFSVLTRLP